MSLIAALALSTALHTSDLPPNVPREFRAVWVATVDNIDWPSKRGIATDQAQLELLSLIDKAAMLHFNAIILQVRPMADALYDSKLEPWSEFLTGEQGSAPKPMWDPLKLAVDEAHKKGIEIHAWFNPFRAWHPAAKSAPYKSHVTRSKPSWVKSYGNFKWLDPGEPEARKFSLQVMQDVVDRYDIDGIHIDDYFYPYPIKGQEFPDDASYSSYRSHGGRLGRSDWRRENVDTFVKSMYEMAHKKKPWMKVGISPFGIYRPGIPAGIQSSVDQYDGLYADARKWLAEGWCDYFTPQLYWRIEQTHQAYPTLLNWWESQNIKNRMLWPGNYASHIEEAPAWPVSELINQIDMTRRSNGATGNVFFSMKPFMKDTKEVDEAFLKGPYQLAALPPICTWLGEGQAPGKPELKSTQTIGTWSTKIKVDKNTWRLAIWAHYGDRWVLKLTGNTDGVRIEPASNGVSLNEVAIAGVDRMGVIGDYAIWKTAAAGP